MKKKLLIFTMILATLLSVAAVAISAATAGATEAGSKRINVWIVAGQSNAAGYGAVSNYPNGYSDADLIDDSITNALYYGKGEVTKYSDFVPITFGLGKDATASGAEIGIATALKNSGEMQAVIKFAYGDTQLSAQGVNASNNIATWTSPSYVANHPEIKFEGDKIGDYYDSMIAAVAEGITKLKAAGYTPVVQGFWWMQGERDSNHGTMTESIYREALTCLINDVRSDISRVSLSDCSAMPFVYGRVLRNPANAPNSATGLAAVQAAQDAVAADTSLKNVKMVDTRYDLTDPESGESRAPTQQDGWHYDSLTQQMIGEAFVKAAYTLMGAEYQHTEAVGIMQNEEALYSAVANYVPGAQVKIMLGKYELFSISDAGLSILNAKINGKYESGDYKVYACVNPTQNMTMVEVTLPGGGVVRKGAYARHAGSSIVATATNAERVKNVSLSYENLILNQYEIVTTEPEASGFGANVYNLMNSFSDATSTRLFAWTAKAAFIGSDAMAIKYRVKGTSAWTVVDAYKLEEPTEYADEDYFKADVDGLLANTEYEYKIGKKNSTDEVNDWSKSYYFSTAKGDEKEFTFIAIGDTQGITWGGTETANKGFMYTKAAFDEAFEEVNNPAFILHTGDVVEEGLKEDQWNLYFKALGEAGASIPHFATLGNHDANLYTNDQNLYFGMHLNHPDNGGYDYLDQSVVGSVTDSWASMLLKYADETFYSYNYGDAHFIVYNSGAYSNQDEMIQKAQRAWLKADLEANKDAKWTIVLSHQGVYHRYGGAYNRNTLSDILEGFDVDLVIQGHSHLVTRTYPMKNGEIVTKENPNLVTKGSGTVYMLIGATALNHDRIDDYVNMETQAVTVSNVGTQPVYTVFNVTENSIEVITKQVDGLVLDSFSIVEKAEEEEEKTEGGLVYTDDFHYFTYKDLNALGLWETENSGKYPAKSPSYSSQRIKLTDGKSVQFNWLKYLGGAGKYNSKNTYVFEIDAYVKNWGDSSDAATRALYVALGGEYGQLGLRETDSAVLLGSSNASYTYSGEETFRIRIEWTGNTVTTTLTDSKGKTQSGTSTSDAYTTAATDAALQTLVFRCEDGEVYLDNFAFSVYTELEIAGYGTLPSNYADASRYPILLFQGGTFKQAFAKDKFKEALTAAKGLVPSHTGVQDHTLPAAQILLRGDAVSLARDENVGQAVGVIDINLNGFTLTQTHGGALFWLRTKTYSNEQQKFTFKVRNGNISLMSYLFAIGTQNNSGSSHMSGPFKNADIVFDNVNIKAQRGTDFSGSLILGSNGSIGGATADKTVEYSITFNSCVFDLRGAVKNTLIFDVSYDALTVKPAVDFEIIGSEITLSRSIVGTKVYTLNSNSSLTITADNSGEYLSLAVPTGAAAGVLTNNTFYVDSAITGSGTSSGTKANLAKTEENAAYVTYTLTKKSGEGIYIDGYGTLPEAYTDASLYPIVLFQGGEFKQAFGVDGFADATNAARGLVDYNKTNPKTAQILFRGNANATSAGDQNLARAIGKIDINLNGYTLTQSYSSYLFLLRVKDYDAKHQTFSMTLRDGTVMLNGVMFALSAQSSVANSQLNSADIDVTNVNIVFVGQSTNSGPIFVLSSGGNGNSSGDSDIDYSFTFTDCNFDFSNLNKSNYIFSANITTDKNVVINNTLTINGGEIIVGKGDGSGTKPYASSLYVLNSTSSVTFGKGSDGNYLKITVPSDVTSYIHNNLEYQYAHFKTVFNTDKPISKPGSDFVTEGTWAEFVNPVTVGSWTTYTLTPEVYVEGYGKIPPAYSDASLYPIVIFRAGEFKSAFAKNEFKQALTAARGLVPSHTGVQDHTLPAAEILLRGDAVSVERDDNVGQTVGVIDINLNGFTLTHSHSGALFWLRTKTYSNEPQTMTFKVRNGSISLASYLFAIGTQNNSGSGHMSGPFKNGNIVFDNVKIEAQRGIKLTDSLIMGSNGSIGANTADTSVEYGITFNDCVFDLSKVIENTLVFNISYDGMGIKPAVTFAINGGELKLAGNIANTTLYSLNTLSSITFGKGSDGKYLTVSVPAGVEAGVLTNTPFAADGKIENVDGNIVSLGTKCVFVKTAEESGIVTYSMYPEVMLDYSIKTSITLYTNFVYNVYVPARDIVLGISIDGRVLDKSEYSANTVILGNEEYYKISIPLAASQSLKDIVVKISLKSGDEVAEAKWTVSTLAYAKKVLASDCSAEERALMLDMLSYARAAYAYFGTEATEPEKLSEINTLLEGKERTPDMSKPAVEPASNRGFKALTLHLGDTPSFRFYLEDGYEASDFVFTTRGSVISTVSGTDTNGRYVEVIMYAYRMCDTITYVVTVDGTQYTESYNVYAYYAYAVSKYPDNVALHTLVERLVAYSESADAYKAFVAREEG